MRSRQKSADHSAPRTLLRWFGLLSCFVAMPLLQSAKAAPVEIVAGSVALTGELVTPPGAGPFPTVLALHGCGGMRARDGATLNNRHRDWNATLTGAGYAVLSLDSFSGRGLKEICSLKDHGVSPRVRSGDVKAALAWLAARPEIDATRLVLLGWSHGGSTVLSSLRQGFLDGGPKPVAAIAYYPGCTVFRDALQWQPSAPLTILIGALDDWTPAAPCRELAERVGAAYEEYPGAYHGFDAVDQPVRLRTGIARLNGGGAHSGTNPEARANSIARVLELLAKIKL